MLAARKNRVNFNRASREPRKIDISKTKTLRVQLKSFEKSIQGITNSKAQTSTIQNANNSTASNTSSTKATTTVIHNSESCEERKTNSQPSFQWAKSHQLHHLPQLNGEYSVPGLGFPRIFILRKNQHDGFHVIDAVGQSSICPSIALWFWFVSLMELQWIFTECCTNGT